MKPSSGQSSVDAYMDLTHKWATARVEWERTYYALTAENDRLRAALVGLPVATIKHALTIGGLATPELVGALDAIDEALQPALDEEQ